MKRHILAAMLPWLCLAFLQAQQTLPQRLQHFYAPLDKSQVPTGFLYDLSWSFASPSDYRGVLTDSNFVSPDVFGMLFGAMRGSMVDSVGLPSPGVFLSRTRPPFFALRGVVTAQEGYSRMLRIAIRLVNLDRKGWAG
jgi:hypothetical protein